MKKSFKKIITTTLLAGLTSQTLFTIPSVFAQDQLIEEMKIMSPFLEATAPEADNEIELGVEEYTGQKINVSWVPNSNYEDRMNIVLASGDLPHIMIIQQKTGSFVTAANAGAFWELTDYLKDYPNLSKVDPEILNNSSLNGKVYGIYRRRDVIRSAVTIRKDWLDAVGMEAPTNVEELYNVAKAFATQDPDGNGKDDTTGIIIPQWPGTIDTNSPFDVLANWFGAPNAWGVGEDGKLVPSFTTDEYLESLKYAKKLYDEGLINADFATLSSDGWNDELINGRGGIIIDTYSRFNQIQSALKAADPENFSNLITFTGNLESENGHFALPTQGYSGFLAIPKSSVKTEEELKQVLTFIDKLNDKEMQVLINNGLEGVNFEVSDGFASTINPDDNNNKVLASTVRSFAQIGTNVAGNEYYVAKPETEAEIENYHRQRELMASDEKIAVFNVAAPYISQTYTQNGTQLDNIIKDARIQFIAGQIDEEGFKAAVELWKNTGGNQVIEELTEQYKANQ